MSLNKHCQFIEKPNLCLHCPSSSSFLADCLVDNDAPLGLPENSIVSCTSARDWEKREQAFRMRCPFVIQKMKSAMNFSDKIPSPQNAHAHSRHYV